MVTFKILNLAREKSFSFAKEIIQHYHVMRDNKEFILSRYFVRSGTLIGVCLEEATVAHTKNEYYSKLNAANKEVKKIQYWIRLMLETNILTPGQADYLLKDAEEILTLVNDILKTLKYEEQNKPIASSKSDLLNFNWLKKH